MGKSERIRRKRRTGYDDRSFVAFSLYTAREFVQETGLYHYRAREYSSGLGRFTQNDPIDFAGGDYNLLRYVANNPVNWIDAFGLQTGGAVGVPKDVRDELLFGGPEEAAKFDKDTNEMTDAYSDTMKDVVTAPIKPAGLAMKIVKKLLIWLWKKMDPGEDFPDDPKSHLGGE